MMHQTVSCLLMPSISVGRGIISPKSLVMDYWPEFAVKGKDNITVEMLISHQVRSLVTIR
ncbi:hypothetical protein DPMN_151331 [Dreissena polymorpha]|uniref:Uncharacterized protein n=1 Tax=Dreissena polymorpha TaxID=45954 RepID=A0A9D4FJR6_DREPO|nr:hypothetical protein DPMN_151331 [Dreissena polymorpha]